MSNNTKTELVEEVLDRLRTMQIVNDLFDEAAANELGVNRTDHRVLDVLEREEPITPSRLAAANRLSRPAMTTVIDRLENAGYARRVPDSEDRRSVLVEMTPLAREQAMRIYAPIGERARKDFGRYTIAELELLGRFLSGAIEFTEAQLAKMAEAAE